MQIKNAAPSSERKVRVNLVDPGALVNGAALGFGLIMANVAGVPGAMRGEGPGLAILVATYVAFLATALLIQRHMQLSLIASSFGSPCKLVTSGIFRYSRNPIYVSSLLPLASFAYVSIPAAVAAISFYVLVMNQTVIRREERELLALFGEAYATYLATVPRWLIFPTSAPRAS